LRGKTFILLLFLLTHLPTANCYVHPLFFFLNDSYTSVKDSTIVIPMNHTYDFEYDQILYIYRDSTSNGERLCHHYSELRFRLPEDTIFEKSKYLKIYNIFTIKSGKLDGVFSSYAMYKNDTLWINKGVFWHNYRHGRYFKYDINKRVIFDGSFRKGILKYGYEYDYSIGVLNKFKQPAYVTNAVDSLPILPDYSCIKYGDTFPILYDSVRWTTEKIIGDRDFRRTLSFKGKRIHYHR
jgi:hypothetical protein